MAGITNDNAAGYSPVGSLGVVVADEGFTIKAYKQDCDSNPTCSQTTPDLGFCANQCTANSGCHSFAYCTGNSNAAFPRCYLKTKQVDFMMKQHPDCTTYGGNGNPIGSGVARNEGSNIASYKSDCTDEAVDYCFKTTTSVDSCQTACNNNDACKSFAFCTGLNNPGTDIARCYLKTADFSTVTSGGGDCSTYYPTTPAMCKDIKAYYAAQNCCGAPLKDLDMNIAKSSGSQSF